MHLGSLFTALASYLDARANQGRWLLRIDDLDITRNQPDAIKQILTCLEAYGLHWDGEVYYQSQHLADYQACLDELARNQLTYRCECSRKSLADLTVDANSSGVYPGICRQKTISIEIPHAIRLKTSDQSIVFNDALQGKVISNLAKQHGDFILKRKDGIIAYQLAVVIDDYLQDINHVVRGCDLLSETSKQIYLQQLLGLPTPAYKHVPVIVGQYGHKLSKQTLATAVDTQSPQLTLFYLLKLLKQNPPRGLSFAKVAEILTWAIQHWHSNSQIMIKSISI